MPLPIILAVMVATGVIKDQEECASFLISLLIQMGGDVSVGPGTSVWLGAIRLM